MTQESIKYFSSMSKNTFFVDLQDGQLVELSTSYYKSVSTKVFNEHGFDLMYDRNESKRRGYRIYRVIKISSNEQISEIFKFNPEELMA